MNTPRKVIGVFFMSIPFILIGIISLPEYVIKPLAAFLCTITSFIIGWKIYNSK